MAKAAHAYDGALAMAVAMRHESTAMNYHIEEKAVGESRSNCRKSGLGMVRAFRLTIEQMLTHAWTVEVGPKSVKSEDQHIGCPTVHSFRHRVLPCIAGPGMTPWQCAGWPSRMQDAKTTVQTDHSIALSR